MTDDVLIAYLLTIPGVSALAGDRGYPYGILPQKQDGQISGEMPAFTVNSISENSHDSIGEDGRPAAGAFQPMRFQIDPYGTTGAEVARLSQVIKDALHAFTGVMASVPVGGAWHRLSTPIQRDPDNLLYHRSMDFEIHSMGG